VALNLRSEGIFGSVREPDANLPGAESSEVFAERRNKLQNNLPKLRQRRVHLPQRRRAFDPERAKRPAPFFLISPTKSARVR